MPGPPEDVDGDAPEGPDLDPMRRADVVQWGPDRLRVTSWRGDAGTAVVTPSPGRPTAPDAIDRTLEVLAARGVTRLLTAAIPPDEQAPFLERGFVVRERLHLLARSLHELPPAGSSPGRIRRGWRRDHAGVLAVDHAAFSPFWRFDRDALLDARAATPTSQLRIADDGGVVGYAVAGRASDTCYLQRLAVRPDAQGRGTGTALVVDALSWARTRKATLALVNTQVGNEGALALYERLGFERRPEGLAVLERALSARTTA